MSIRQRLALMLIMGIMIPVMLVNWVRLYQYEDRENIQSHEDYDEYFKRLNMDELIQDLMAELLEESKKNPDELYDITYLESLDKALWKNNLRFVIESQRKGHIYGEPLAPLNLETDAYETLQPYFLIRSFVIETDIGDQVTVKVLTEFFFKDSQEKSTMMRDVSTWMFAFILVYVGLVIWVSRSINKPLDRLQEMTEKFSKGDYSVRINDYTNDKIGEVSKAFDQMCDEAEIARQLKDKYEENRRLLIASISHDLKTPLTAIKGNVSAIDDGILKNEAERKEAFLVINNKIDYMQRLIEELFLYSKLDMDKEQFFIRTVPLHRFIEDVVEEWEMDISTEGLELSFTYEKDWFYQVNIDVDKMKRVIVNILENALKYGLEDRPIIEINLKKSDVFYECTIKDNGPGVDKEELSSIFERFYRVDESRNNAIEGSGLGLAISKSIVEHHGGRLSAESDLGKGLKLKIELPIVRRE